MHLLSLIWRIENDLHQTLSNGGFEKNEESMETRQSINGINNRLDSCAFMKDPYINNAVSNLLWTGWEASIKW